MWLRLQLSLTRPASILSRCKSHAIKGTPPVSSAFSAVESKFKVLSSSEKISWGQRVENKGGQNKKPTSNTDAGSASAWGPNTTAGGGNRTKWTTREATPKSNNVTSQSEKAASNDAQEIKSKFSFRQSAPASFAVKKRPTAEVPVDNKNASQNTVSTAGRASGGPKFGQYLADKSGAPAAIPTVAEILNGQDAQKLGAAAQRHTPNTWFAEKSASSTRKHFDKGAEVPTNGGKSNSDVSVKPKVRSVVLSNDGVGLRSLASMLSLKLEKVVQKVKEYDQSCAGIAEGGDMVIDSDVAELIALEAGFEVTRENPKASAAELRNQRATGTSEHELLPRPPVVCIMGHVDHGKTTLLDSLRKANVAEGEAGGITQKLSAFKVNMKGKEVVFVDTPGHQAFSSMRVNGAMATDVVVLVVAFDDGIRPQTIEALKVAKESKCQILVALNKVDKIPYGERVPQRSKILTQLSSLGLQVEEFGGDTPVLEVSGKTGDGLEALVDMLSLQTDILELRAPVKGAAEAIVMEAVQEKGKGVIVDVIVKWASLHVGDAVVAGTAYGKVKAMLDDKGASMKVAPPSTPVRLLGLRTVPTAGQQLIAVQSEAKAKEIADRRSQLEERKKQILNKAAIISKEAADNLAAQSADVDGAAILAPLSAATSVSVLLKSDSVGTMQALQNIVNDIKKRCENVGVSIIDSVVGAVTASDIERCGSMMTSSAASNCVSTCVLAFNVNTNEATRQLAKEHDITIFRDTVIYRLEDALLETMSSVLPKEKHMVEEGTASVLKLFSLNDNSDAVVLGLEVTSGRLKMNGQSSKYVYRLRRGDVVLADEIDPLELRRFKDKVHEVEKGNECGMKLNSSYSLKEGDIIECRRIEMRNGKLIMKSV